MNEQLPKEDYDNLVRDAMLWRKQLITQEQRSEHDAELKAESELIGWHKGFDDCNKANEENKTRLIAEVRKPLVDALERIRIQIRKHNETITQRVQIVTDIIDNALAKDW